MNKVYPLLGNNTKSVAAPALSRSQGRALRYKLTELSGRELGFHSRPSTCQRIPTHKDQRSNTYRRGISKNDAGSAFFYGVNSCGDVWGCPVCSQKISETRRLQIQDALRQHRASGGVNLLLTFTFSHTRDQSLDQNVRGLAKALQKMKQSRGYKALQSQYKYTGQIRALEVTHSNANGWHPHVHEIWFLDDGIDQGKVYALKVGLFKLWRAACEKAGVGLPSREHGVDVQFRSSAQSDSVGAYVSKWGFELTYSHTKKGGSSRSPWAILRDMHRRYTFRDAQLWKEYCSAFAGRAQLFWSRGLKASFGIDQSGDTSVADRPEPIHVRTISREEWGDICYYSRKAKVLDVAEKCPSRLDYYLKALRKRKTDYQRYQADQRKVIQISTKIAHPDLAYTSYG